MNAAIEHLKQELKGLRTGRANPGMVEHVQVEAYGTHMRLPQMATITPSEARQLVITPFDSSTLHAIKRGLDAANLNVQVIVDGNLIRVKVPEMDAAVRQEMCKQAKKRCEEAKISIRNVRREGNEEVKKKKAGGDLTEDMVKKLEKQIQELTDKFCKTADEIEAEKEKEIQTI